MTTKCDICDTTLTGRGDTFGTYPANLCHSCYLDVKRDHDNPNGLSPLAQIALCRLRRRSAQKPTFDAPYLPDHWKRKDGLYEPGQEAWKQLGYSTPVCPTCNKPLLFDVNEWESETGVPTEGGVLVWCATEYEAYCDPARREHGANCDAIPDGDIFQSQSQFIAVCVKIISDRLMRQEGLSK